MANLKKHLLINEVLKLYKAGLPKKNISLLVGVTEKTVAVWIKQSEVKKDALEKRIAELENDMKIIKEKLNIHE